MPKLSIPDFGGVRRVNEGVDFVDAASGMGSAPSHHPAMPFAVAGPNVFHVIYIEAAPAVAVAPKATARFPAELPTENVPFVALLSQSMGTAFPMVSLYDKRQLLVVPDCIPDHVKNTYRNNHVRLLRESVRRNFNPFWLRSP
jgi:hypothetical protein